MAMNPFGAHQKLQSGFSLTELLVVLLIFAFTGMMISSVLSMSSDSQARMISNIEANTSANEIANIVSDSRLSDSNFCSSRFALDGAGFNQTFPDTLTSDLEAGLRITSNSGFNFQTGGAIPGTSKVRILNLKLVAPAGQSAFEERGVKFYSGRVELQLEEDAGGNWIPLPKRILGSVSFSPNTSGGAIISCVSQQSQISCSTVGGFWNGTNCLTDFMCARGTVSVVRRNPITNLNYINCESPREITRSLASDPNTGCAEAGRILIKEGSGTRCMTVGEYIALKCPIKGQTLVPDNSGGVTCRSVENILGLTCNDSKFLVSNGSSDSACNDIDEFIGPTSPTTYSPPVVCSVNGTGFYPHGTPAGSCRNNNSCIAGAFLNDSGPLAFCNGATAKTYSCGGAFTYSICEAPPTPAPTLPASYSPTTTNAPATSLVCAINNSGFVGGAGTNPSCKEYSTSTTCTPGVNSGEISEPTCPTGFADDYACGSAYRFKICKPEPTGTTAPPVYYPDICIDDWFFGIYACYPDPRNFSSTTTMAPPTTLNFCRSYYNLPAGYTCYDQETMDEDGDGVCNECRYPVRDNESGERYFRFQDGIQWFQN